MAWLLRCSPSENGGFALQSSVTQPDMAVEDFMLCLQTYLLAVTFCWPEQAKNVIAYQYQVFQLRYLRLPVAKLQARDQEWRRAIAMNGWDWSHGNQDREALIITVDSMQVPAERTEASPVLSSNTRSNFHRSTRRRFRVGTRADAIFWSTARRYRGNGAGGQWQRSDIQECKDQLGGQVFLFPSQAVLSFPNKFMHILAMLVRSSLLQLHWDRKIAG